MAKKETVGPLEHSYMEGPTFNILHDGDALRAIEEALKTVTIINGGRISSNPTICSFKYKGEQVYAHPGETADEIRNRLMSLVRDPQNG